MQKKTIFRREDNPLICLCHSSPHSRGRWCEPNILRKCKERFKMKPSVQSPWSMLWQRLAYLIHPQNQQWHKWQIAVPPALFANKIHLQVNFQTQEGQKSALNTVFLLWTLYYTKHRNWFHESLVMLEIFTKLPLKI